jgi:hypothetical protein
VDPCRAIGVSYQSDQRERRTVEGGIWVAMPIGLVTDLAVEDSGIPVGVQPDDVWQTSHSSSVYGAWVCRKTVNNVNGDDVTHGHDVLSSITTIERSSTMLPKCSIWPDE